MSGSGLFIFTLQSEPRLYFMVVLTLIISITLHELAHGWAAIWFGDDTPIHTGHMTGNPLIHMGPVSLAVVFIMGIGWGQMPVDPTRMRGRYAHANVALAGPAMNLLLAFLALTALNVWINHLAVGAPRTNAIDNGQLFLTIFGFYNIGLALFNLAPVPPLDGSTVLAEFNTGYRNFLRDHAEKVWLMFPGYFILLSVLEGTPLGLWHNADRIALWYSSLW